MRPLGEALARQGFRVRGIRLPGHGRTPEAMAQVTQHDWLHAAEDALFSLKPLARHVFLAGLSMGALLSVLLAARHPDRVHGLALMAPAMRFIDPVLATLRTLRLLPMLDVARPFIEKHGTDIEDVGARDEAPVLTAFPASRLRDVLSLQEQARAALPRVTAPTLVALARNDHVVSRAGGRELVEGLTAAAKVRFIELDRGFHIMPRDLGKDVLFAEIGDFFQRLRGPLP
jgi:carboxylesterase